MLNNCLRFLWYTNIYIYIYWLATTKFIQKWRFVWSQRLNDRAGTSSELWTFHHDLKVMRGMVWYKDRWSHNLWFLPKRQQAQVCFCICSFQFRMEQVHSWFMWLGYGNQVLSKYIIHHGFLGVIGKPSKQPCIGLGMFRFWNVYFLHRITICFDMLSSILSLMGMMGLPRSQLSNRLKCVDDSPRTLELNFCLKKLQPQWTTHLYI